MSLDGAHVARGGSGSAATPDTRVPGSRASDTAETDPSVFARLARVARRDPAARAVTTSTRSITYGELVAAARRGAAALSSAHGVGGPTAVPIAVIADSSVETVIAACAVLASGHPLVLVDDRLPRQKRAAVLASAGAVVADRPLSGTAVEVLSPPVTRVDRGRTAMVCFTSGSTGDPKGVVLDHGGVAGKADDLRTAVGLTPSDVVGCLLPVSFGAGTTALLAGLLSGSTVALWDPRVSDPAALGDWLRAVGATTMHASVALVRSLSAPDGPRPVVETVRAVVTYGEPLLGVDVVRCRDALAPRADILNWYAVTECGVVAWSRVSPTDDVPEGRVRAGRAVPGRRLDVVGEDGRAVAPGSAGEVIVRGGRPAVGYLGRESDRFGVDAEGVPFFRTGDRGRVDDEGLLHLLGRLDDAVKIRGYLVEPGEVAAAVAGVEGVADVAVTSTEVDDRTELVAYVACVRGHDVQRVVRAVRASAGDRLPQWMIPRFVVPLERIPRTTRGKVDRAALPAPEVTTPSARTRTSSSLTVVATSELVGTALGVTVDLDDDLVAAGADSLSFVRMATMVRERFHVDLDPARVAAEPTVRAIADLIDETTRAGSRSRRDTGVLVPLRETGTGVPLFVVTGAGAPAVSLIPLVRRLDPERPVYGLQAHGLESRARPDRTVRAAARRYVEQIRRVRPTGPYALAGHSMGGIVALEMASMLHDAGEDVVEVVVVDSRLTTALLDGVDAAAEEAPESAGVDPDAVYEKLRLSLPALLRIRLQMMVAGYVTFAPITQWMLFYNKGLRMLKGHTPRTYPGSVTVLRTAGNEQDDRVWSRVVTGRISIADVPGSHTDLLREPHVESVAREIERAVADITVPAH
ncbi:AMP-binding protein [Rhodococcoides kroppenstedtii]|uniref:AMP-binding protein n=1 Tax=Rhodococcoides kroppenstedtii TaxID=293050 RepID=UPI00362D9AAA